MTKKKQPATQVQMLPMSAVEVNAGQLEGLPANPREIRDEKFEKLKANIQKYPELLEYRSLMVYPMPNGKHIIIGGNMRYRAMQELGYTEVPCVIIPAETPVEKLGAYTILDNNGFGKWDWDLLANEWSDWNMEDLGLDWEFAGFGEDNAEDKDKPKGDNPKTGSLTDRFVIPPFSILDTRKGYWQARKKVWRSIIGDMGESRKDRLLQSPEVKYKDLYLKTRKHREELGIGFKEYLEKYVSDEVKEQEASRVLPQGVSLFDPVLSEIICRWFTPYGGAKIFDCFAGDTQKGLVFGQCGFDFTGIELRQEQVDINNRVLEGRNLPIRYICDDGQNVAQHIAASSMDLLFSCPPYYDLEVYSDLENDASNQGTYSEFLAILRNAFSAALGCLKDNRFAVVIVGDVRDKNSGCYYNFVDDTKRIFKENGAALYNELILVETCASTALRASRYMESRKVAKMHQNVLVFYKGNTKEIKNIYPKIEFSQDELTQFDSEVNVEPENTEN